MLRWCESIEMAETYVKTRDSAGRSPGARAAAFCLTILPALQAVAAPAQHWVGTWSASPVAIDNSAGPLGVSPYTIRNVVHTSLAGTVARVVLTNEMGTRPLTIKTAQIAISDGTRGSIHAAMLLSFNGMTSVTIPVGAKAVSDSVAMQLPFGSNVAVSLCIPIQSIPVLTQHSFANQSNFLVPGDFVAKRMPDTATDIDSWIFLSAIEVQAPLASGALAVLGDSITDGAFSTRGANRRWPDALARRLEAEQGTPRLAVLNAGIGGNRVLHDYAGQNAGPSALARFDRDVLAQAGVRYLVILEGINDIGWSTRLTEARDPVSAPDIIFGISQLIERAHAHGIKVFLGTIMPDGGLDYYYSNAGEAERQEVNRWIRSTTLSDGVIDFDKVMADPEDPKRLLAAYDKDHIHPNDLGHQAMADAAAYVLFQELRLQAARTAYRSALVNTLRENLMKLGASVESSVQPIGLHLPAACIHRHDWQINKINSLTNSVG